MVPFRTTGDMASLIDRGAGQAMLYVLIDMSLSGISGSSLDRPCDLETDECRARHFFGYWQNAVASAEDRPPPDDDLCEDAVVEFLMICPRPQWYSLHPSRSMMGVRYQGERYIMSFDGVVGGAERISIGTLPGEGPSGSADFELDPDDLVSAAFYAATGQVVLPYSHEFAFVSVDGLELYALGCSQFWGDVE